MISIRGLKKSFGGTDVFRDVNLEIRKGDAVVIIGGSGCGKSTLLRCVNRLEIPDEGEVLIDGANIHAPGADVEGIRRKLGMVYQSFNLFSHLNVMENMILAPMRVLGLPKKQALARAEELLELVGMENRRWHMPRQLSGGQKQRVAIARAMAMDPEVMLFDEPTSALDPTMVDEVESVMRRLIESGMTSIIVTHEMGFAKRIASKVVFLAQQGIYEQGDAAQVFDSPARELTRQFLYRARMLEKRVSTGDIDVYSLCSEVRGFAMPYGFSPGHSYGLELLCDELLLPILKASNDAEFPAVLRFVADESGVSHLVLLEFPTLESDPLAHGAVDEMGVTLLRSFTEEITSERNGDGAWEVRAKLKQGRR